MTSALPGRVAGLDFGTTNSVAAVVGSEGGEPSLLNFGGPDGPTDVFRSALCFWHENEASGGIAVEAGPAAIEEYLLYPSESRFLQSFKSVAANPSFDSAPVFARRFRFEELGRLFLSKLVLHAGGALDGLERVVVGRPVHYAGARPDPLLARQRYDAMFEGVAPSIHYVYEPLAGAFSYASRVSEPATLLVADFGGGTSDFSVVRVNERGAVPRCVPLGHAGVGIAGDRFDQRIVERLVLPMLGKGGCYRSFDKVLEIPAGYFADFSDWSKLALMRNRRTLDELDKLRRSALDPVAIERMIAIVDHELGYSLYDSVGRLKRAISLEDVATFQFSGGGLDIAAQVTRAEFEAWIAADLTRMEAAIEDALANARVAPTDIDRVFLTGGTSLVPAVRRLFTARFGDERIASGGELTSIAHGLAMIAQQEDISQWLA